MSQECLGVALASARSSVRRAAAPTLRATIRNRPHADTSRPACPTRANQAEHTAPTADYRLRKPLKEVLAGYPGDVYPAIMSTPVSSIRNLGPAFEAECARAGIPSAEALRALGADAAYARMLRSGTRPHFIGYYVLVMALQNRPWNDCKGEEKKALRKTFDAIKAQAFDADLSAFERIMDEIGVREQR